MSSENNNQHFMSYLFTYGLKITPFNVISVIYMNSRNELLLKGALPYFKNALDNAMDKSTVFQLGSPECISGEAWATLYNIPLYKNFLLGKAPEYLFNPAGQLLFFINLAKVTTILAKTYLIENHALQQYLLGETVFYAKKPYTIRSLSESVRVIISHTVSTLPCILTESPANALIENILKSLTSPQTKGNLYEIMEQDNFRLKVIILPPLAPTPAQYGYRLDHRPI